MDSLFSSGFKIEHIARIAINTLNIDVFMEAVNHGLDTDETFNGRKYLDRFLVRLLETVIMTEYEYNRINARLNEFVTICLSEHDLNGNDYKNKLMRLINSIITYINGPRSATDRHAKMLIERIKSIVESHVGGRRLKKHKKSKKHRKYKTKSRKHRRR